MSGQIFISYRRDDASYPAGRLYDRLLARLPNNQIFIDVDLEPGIDFVEAIETSVGSCDVLIAVIGKRWLVTSDEEGKRRLDDPEDFVRVEIATALKRKIRVIPVLVDGASVPRSGDLPDDLKLMARLNALEVSHNRFNADFGRLVTTIESVLETADADRKQREEMPTSAPMPTPEGDVETAFNCGNTSFAKQEYHKAISYFTEAIRLKPDFADAYHNRGVAYKSLGKLNEAISDYTEAIHLDPNVLTYNNRGWVYCKKKEFDKAISDYTEAIRLAPDFVSAYKNRGNAFYAKQEYNKAIGDYTKAIRLKPDHAENYINRGAAYKSQGELDKAISDYTEAIRLNPSDASAYYNRGNAYDQNKEYDRAITEYAEAIRLDPNYALAYNNRGWVYAKKKEYDKAISDYTKAIRLDPDSALAYKNRGLAYRALGKNDEANADFAKSAS